MTSVIVSSCTSQTDLESLVNDQDIPVLLKNTIEVHEIADPDYGLLCYDTKEAQNFKFGSVAFSKFSLKDGFDYSSNSVKICVDNHQSKRYLGTIINLVKEDEGKELATYLNNKYGNPEQRDTGENGIALFWNVDEKNQWIFLIQNTEYTRKKDSYLSTKVIVIKQGVRVENSNDSDVFSILDNFNLAYPKVE